jgi:hypothetical protein
MQRRLINVADGNGSVWAFAASGRLSVMVAIPPVTS